MHSAGHRGFGDLPLLHRLGDLKGENPLDRDGGCFLEQSFFGEVVSILVFKGHGNLGPSPLNWERALPISYRPSSRVSFARHTSPMPPAPIDATIS